MKALVFGMGLQGKATVHDLENSDLVDEIVIADQQIAHVEDYLNRKRYSKTRALRVNASRESELRAIIRQVAPDIIVCMLPPDFGYPLAKIGLEFNLPFVSSSYTGKLAELDAEARDRGLIILPEMGMDPGIDLVLARLALKRLDEVHGLYSYGAGIPELACANNPLNYKITWTFDGVLKSYKRPARFLDNGQEISISGEAIFRDEYGHQVEIPGIGSLEAFPNGDAVHHINIFQLGKTVRDMGRFALRYPGHRRTWRVMAELGFLDDTLPDGRPRSD